MFARTGQSLNLHLLVEAKTVLFNINQTANTEISAINIPIFINDPWKKSVSACILKVAAAGSCADSVSKNSPLKYIGTM